MKKQQSLQFIPQSIPPSPKKRIHELSYAQKVVQPISADKSHIKLNESLFNAKVTAKESSNYIKDIQKDLQHTIKKYDDFLRLSASRKKITEQICSSPLRMQPIDAQEQEEEALLNDLQKLTASQEVRRFSIPVERSELRLSSYKAKEDLFPVDGISPIKSNHMSRRNSMCNNNQQKFQSDYYGSYAKIHRKKSPTSPPLFVSPPKEQKSPDDVAKRNAEWKQKLQEKLMSEQKKQNDKEIKDCTFKPKIMGRSHTPKVNQKSTNGKKTQFKFEIQEIIHIIDDLHQFSKQLKKKK